MTTRAKPCLTCSRQVAGGFFAIPPSREMLTTAFGVQNFFQCLVEDVSSMNNSQVFVRPLCGGTNTDGFIPIAMNQPGATFIGEPGISTPVGIGQAQFVASQLALTPIGNQGKPSATNDVEFAFQMS